MDIHEKIANEINYMREDPHFTNDLEQFKNDLHTVAEIESRYGVNFRISLERIKAGKPLTYVQNNPEDWVYECDNNQGVPIYYHKRYKPLLRYGEGENARYVDIELVVIKSIHSNDFYNLPVIVEYIHDRFGIEFPYYPPDEPFYVFIESFTNINFTVGVFGIMHKNNWYRPDVFWTIKDDNWVRISSGEYMELRKAVVDRGGELL